jgi:zinc transporter ZupT
MDPTLTVLLYSSLAAGAAVLGAGPFVVREKLPVARIGWANALAAGLMLGAAYALVAVGLQGGVVSSAVGGAVGVGFVYWTHAVSGTDELGLYSLKETDPVYGYKVLLVHTLHGASEGIAIGVAMVVDVPFGILTALAIAVHNIPEATVLSGVLTSRGVRVVDAAGLSVVTNVPQVLLAVVTFAVITAAPAALPWALGFAVGALIYLVMAELLPESYHQAGSTTIALVTIVAMGIVVLMIG